MSRFFTCSLAQINARVSTCVSTTSVANKRVILRRWATLAGQGVVAACLFAAGAAVQAQTVTPLGEQAAAVSGLTGTTADIGVDGSGNVYVLDASSKAVVKYAAGNAGSGTTVMSGFSAPTGMAVTSSGGICVADGGANVVVCGGSMASTTTTGFSSPADVAIDSSGNIIVADSGSNSIMRATPGGAPATIISGVSANSIAVNSQGDVFATDSSSLYRYAAPSYAATTIATFTRSSSVAVGLDDAVYLNNRGTKLVSKYVSADSYATGTLVTKAAAVVAADASGNVYTGGDQSVLEAFSKTQRFADTRVGAAASATKSYLFYLPSGGTIAAPRVTLGGNPALDFTDAGTGSCTTNGTSYTYNPGEMCTVDVKFTAGAVGLRRGAIEILDASSNVLATSYLAGVGVGPQAAFTPATVSTVFASSGLDTSSGQFDGFGNLYYTSYVGGTNNSTIFKLTPGGTVTSVVGFTNPLGMVIDGAGNLFYLGLSGGAEHLYKLPYNTTTPVDLGTTTVSGIGMAIDRSGNLYIPDNNSITKIDAVTYTRTTIAQNTGSPVGMTMDANDNLFFVDNGSNRLKVVYANTSTITDLSGTNLSNPYGIAVDPAGNVYVGNFNSSNLARYAAGTYASSILATGVTPEWLAFAPSGDLYAGAYGTGIAKVALSAAPSLTLPQTAVGATSAATSLTLTNAGNADLTVTPPGSGSNPALTADFQLANSTNCPWLYSTSSQTALASGASCKYDVQFAPTIAQTYAGSLTLSYLSALNVATSTAVTLNGTAYDGNFLGLTLTHSTTPSQGGTVVYQLAAKNNSPLTTSGNVIAQIALPSGFTLTAGSGTNWTCNTTSLLCTYTGTVAGNGSSSTLSLTASLSFTTTGGTATASATGGGATNTATASDVTTVNTSPTYIVDSIADAPGDCTSGHTAGTCTLRTAMTTANADASSIVGVLFDSTLFSTPQTITLQSSLPTLTRALSIIGPGQTLLTISGADQYSLISGTVLTISDVTLSNGYRAGAPSCINLTANLTMTAVTVQNCKADDSNAPGTTLYGGAIGSSTSTTISRSTIRNNTFTGIGLLRGGGLYATGTLNIDNSTISGNTLTGGIGIYGAGVYMGAGTITDSVISGNTGQNTGSTGDVIGGGLYAGQTTTLTRVKVTGNSLTGKAQALGGGAYFVGTPTVTYSTFSQNTATSTTGSLAAGGGIYTGSMILRNNVFSGNVVSSTGGNARGGAIYTATSTTFTVTGNMIDGNSATSSTPGSGNGGGMALAGTTTTSIDASTAGFNYVTNNTATGNGGGIWAANGANATVTLRGFTIANNTASGTGSSGGGLYIGGRANTLSYLSIYGNTADKNGAGLASGTATVTTFSLSNVNISGNTTATSGPGGFYSAVTSGTVSLSNNTIAGNLLGSADSNVTISKASTGGNNILQGCSTNCTTTTTVTAPTNLGTLAYNGGPTKTLLPQAGSNVIGVGSICSGTDLRGYTRTGCDIGAVNSLGTGPAPLTISLAPVTAASTTTSLLSATVAYTGTAPSSGFFFRAGTGYPIVGTCTGSSSPLTCTATVDTSSLPTGTFTLNAYQTGSLTVSGGEASASTSTPAGPTTSTPTITVSAKSSNYGDASTTLTASVAYTGATAPTGAFTFQVDSGATVTATCTGSASPLSCSASYNTSTLTVGTHSIAGASASDTNFNSVSATANLVVSATAPGAPTIGTATKGDGQATVTFSAPASNGGAAITSYTVTSNPGNITASGTSSPITVTGLTNGTAYTFTVTATNSVGTGSASSASNSVTPGAAPVVSSFTYGSIVAYNPSTTDPTSLNLSLFATNSPTSYAVGSATTSKGGSVTVDATGMAYYTPPAGYRGNDSFTYTASNASGTSNSATVTVTVGNPTILAYLPAASANIGNAYNPSATAIQFEDGKSPYTINSVTGLPSGLSYANGVISGTPTATCSCTVSISVTDNSTPSGYTATINKSLTVNPGVPGVPTIGTATAGNAQASVTFTAPASNGGAAITSYTVTSSPGGQIGTGTASPITVVGLINGTAYTFTVAATNSVGTGTASSASNSVTPKGSQTITFANPGTQNFGTTPTLTATSDSFLTVTFTSSTTSVCTITSGGGLTFVSTGTCTINTDQAGNSSYNAAAQVSRSFTVAAVAPGAPTIGTATAGNAQATVTFTAPASNGGAAITGYTVTSLPGGITATGTTSPITVTGLTNGTSYTFTVTATNASSTGSASSPSNAVTPKGSQTITFANPGSQNFGTTPTLSASSDSSLSVTFTSSTTGVCTVTSGGVLSFVTTGTCTINADQSGNGTYNAATTVTRSFTVNAVVPGAPLVSGVVAGDGQATVSFSAPSSNGGSAITGYTVTSSPGGYTATGSASPITVTGLANGTNYTFTVTATNAAGTGSASGPSSAVRPQGAQTITFANPGSQNFGTTPTLTATSTSGLAVTFTSATTSVCTITPVGTLTFVTTGTCTINADQAGNTAYVAATQVSRSFAVNAVVPGAPTIGTVTAENGQAVVNFAAPSSSGGSPITLYTVTSSPGGIVATAGSSPITITGLTNGTAYTFTVKAANSAGTGSASAASASVTPQGSQTITFANPGTQTFGTTPTLSATATSSLAVTFTSATTSVCTVTSGGALTFVTSGTCTINADQAGNAAYTAAPTVSRSFTVNATVPGAPTIGGSTAGDAQATVSFTAPSSNGGSNITGYTVTSSPGGIVASGSGSPITIGGLTNGTAYTFTVTATNSAGTSTSSAATLSVTPQGSQTITFANPGTQNFGTTPTLTATASSGLTVSFVSTTPTVCAITSGGTLSFTTTGTCAIRADQSGNAAYTAATSVSRSFSVNGVAPGAPTIGTAAAGDAQATISFTAPSFNGGAAITGYTVTSAPGGIVASGSASPITVLGLTNGTAYTFTVTATNSVGTGTASAATVSVTPQGSQTITFANPGTQTFGTTPTLSATATSGLAVSLTSSTTGVCSITSGGQLTFTATGTCTIDANQAGNSAYTAATAVSRSFSVSAASQTITFANPGTQTFGTTPTLSASATSGLSVSFSSATSGVCSITSGGQLSFAAAGTCVVNADQSGNANYNAATTVSRSFTVNAIAPDAPTVGAATAGDTQATVSFTAPASTGGSAITSYTVTSLPGGLTASGTSSPIVVTGLTNGTAYTFTVKATNAAGTSSASAATNSVTPTAAQTITFANPGVQTFGTTPTLSATASSGLTVSFTSTTPAICSTTTGGTLAFSATGTCSIQASQAGNAAFNAATSVMQSFTVQAASQTITFALASPVTYGVSPIALSATGGASGNAVTFSVVSGPGAISGSTLSVNGAGSIVVAADQAGNSNYNAATQVRQTLVVNQAAQTITFNGPASPVTYGVGPIALVATGGASTSPVVFTVVSGSATISGSTLTVTGAGTVVIAANQAADANYGQAVEVQRTLVVNKASQTLTFNGPASPVTYGVAPIALTATPGASTGAVSFSVVSGPATISGSTLTITGAGNVVIAADQAGDANYAAATQVQRTLVVNKAAQTLTFNGPASPVTYGVAPITLTATPGASTGAVSFSVISGPASITGSTLTITGAGTVVIAADQAGDANYAAATQIQRTLVVNKASQTLTFNGPASPVTYGVAPITLSATAGASTGAVSFSVISGPATISGSTLTVTGAGTIVVAADQAGDTNYAAATQIQRTLVVNKAAQTLIFNGPASPVNYGVAPITLTATPGASTGAVSFSVISGPASITGSALTINGAGTVVVAADQAGDANYAAATQVQRTLLVNKAAQTLTFNGPASPVTYGVAPITLTATLGASTGAVSFSVISGPASITGSTLTINGAGTVVIAADQAGDANYAAATQIQRTLVVNKAAQTLTFNGPASPVTYGVAPIALTATPGASTGAVSFSVISGPASITGSTLTITGAGTVVVAADQAGDANYAAATQIQRTLVVNKASQTLTFSGPASPVTFGVAPITLSATPGASTGAVSFSVVSGPATISGSTLTITGAGTVVVAADQAGDANYAAATQVQRTLVVNKATPQILWPAPADIVYGTALGAAQLNASATGVSSPPINGAFAYTPASGTVLNVGASQSLNAVFTPTDAANYTTASASVVINVNAATQSISFTQPASPIVYGSATTVALTASGGGSGSAVTFASSGPGSISGSTLTITGAGSVVVTASQAGSNNYSAATPVVRTIVVNKAAAALTGPANAVSAPYKQAGTVPFTVAGQFSGSGISAPSGNVTYVISDSTNATVGSGSLTIAAGAVTVPVANTLAAGTYTVKGTYAGDANYATSATATATVVVGQLQPTITWAQPSSITYGANLASVLNASAAYNSAPVAGSFSYTNGTVAITSATVLPAGSYTLSVLFTPTDTINYKPATANVSLVVSKATAGATITVDKSQAFVQNPVTFTATLASAVSTPTGTVTFFDGTSQNVIGTATAQNGVATLTTSSLAAGAHAVGVVYSGYGNFNAATSNTAAVTLLDFSLTFTSSSGASGSSSGSATSQTVLPGGTATYDFIIAAPGTVFPSDVTVTLSGVPSGFTATVTPDRIAAGTPVSTVKITVTAPKTIGALKAMEVAPIALGLLLLPFSGRLRRHALKLGRLAAIALLMIVSVAAMCGLTGCGTGGGGYFSQPKKAVTINVTVTSGNLSHSTPLTLEVL